MSVLKQTPVQNPLDFSYFLCYCTKQVKVRDFLDAAASLPLFLFPLSILPVGHSNRGDGSSFRPEAQESLFLCGS